MLVVACYLHFAVNQPANDRRLAEASLRATTAEQKVTEADVHLERSRKTIAQLEQRVSKLETENGELRSAPTTKPTKPTPGGVAHPTPVTAKPKPVEVQCDEHDPMCGTIKRN